MAYLYEILIRFNENGFQGCHAIDVGDNGNEQPARPIAEEDVAALVGDQSAVMLASIEASRARAEAAEAQIADLEQRAVTAENTLAGKNRTLELAHQTIRMLRGE